MKKSISVVLLVITLFSVSCSSIRVSSDYESATDFSKYKTFAFYKTGIDKAPISDIDKRRIMRSIETELQTKGIQLTENPDLLVSIFTKAREQVDVYQPHWTPYYYNPYQTANISKYTEGTLFIDIIDAKEKKLIWQGIGSGALTKSSKPEKREENIQVFVKEILEKFPPIKQ